jgi:hypothetical protein
LSRTVHAGPTMRQITTTSILCALLAVAACGDDEASPAQPRAADATRDLSELVGDFQVRLTASNPATGANAQTSVFGVVKDGPDPAPIAWHVTSDEGDCSLLEPDAPFCATPCGGSAVCTAQDQCTPYPKARDVGAVQIHGLGDRTLRIEPIAGKYIPVGDPLPYPPCTEGDVVQLRAAGGAYSEFSVETPCIAPLEFEASARLEPGHDLELSWARPGEPELARIQVKVDISHHGGAKGKIECDTADDGSFTIASALVDRLVELGVAGFPTIGLTRISRAAPEDEPRSVTLSLLETVERPVEVPGVMSCTDSSQCPGDQQCNSSLLCQAN